MELAADVSRWVERWFGAQHFCIICWQAVDRVQADSNLKWRGFGTVVWIFRIRETWSDVIRGKDDRVVLGKTLFQARLKKARSSHSRVGEARLLDQVSVCLAGVVRLVLVC